MPTDGSTSRVSNHSWTLSAGSWNFAISIIHMGSALYHQLVHHIAQFGRVQFVVAKIALNCFESLDFIYFGILIYIYRVFSQWPAGILLRWIIDTSKLRDNCCTL